MIYMTKNTAQSAPLVGGMVFSKFNQLPPEIRLAIWETAFNAVIPSVAIYSSSKTCNGIMIAHHHSETRCLPSVATASREALREWIRLTQPTGLRDRLGNRVYIPRTIFLTNTDTIVNKELNHLKDPIAHIAIDISDSSDIFLAFEALAQFPSLRTVIVTIPSYTVTEEDILTWQQSLRQNRAILRCISDLIDGCSRDGEWDKTSFVGCLLRNHLDGPEVRAYYSHASSPRIKLYIDRTKSGEADMNGDNPWMLYFYTDD